MGVGSQVLPNGPVQESEAIAPIAAAGAVAAGTSVGLNVGWALRETDPLNIIDDVPEGETQEALENRVLNATQARKSNNQSTLIDNQQIVAGIESSAYADAKIAAIEKLNDQESQEDVLNATDEPIDDYETTVKTNYLKSWNETVNEAYTLAQAVYDHSDVSGDFFYAEDDTVGARSGPFDEIVTETYEMPDGSEFEVKMPKIEAYGTYRWSPITLTDSGYDRDPSDPEFYVDDGELKYGSYSDWSDTWDDINSVFANVRDGIEKWVDGVYRDVQAGKLEVDDLLTPREQAELTSEDEDFPQALADLQALNVSVDLEREAEIYLPHVDATVWGQIGYAGSDPLEVGEIDPENKSAIYLTYDISQGQGEWSAYEEGIDGGELTFTAEPFAETVYYVDTVAGETVELTDDDFEVNYDNDEWTVDLSDDLDDAITEVDQIEYYAETEETQYETIQLQDEFEIITFTDSEGEEYEEADFERSEPHDDDNYITEEEWQEQQERNEELIEKYEDSGGGGIGFLDGEEIPAEGVLLIVLAIFAALFGR